jgi:hypothetical protein
MLLSASAISTITKKVSLTTAGLVSVTLALSTASAQAVIIAPQTIIDTAVDPTGSSIEVNGDFSASDTINLNVSGTVDVGILRETPYVTNAAGILTEPAPFFPLGIGQSSLGRDGNTAGALLIGNSSLGFFQLFAPNGANGAGNPNPTQSLSTGTISLSSIFGGGLTNGTVLQFAIEPAVFSQGMGLNSTVARNIIGGGVSRASVGNIFTVTGSINRANVTTAVPEPFTIVGTLIGSAAALQLRKKLKNN